MEVGSCKRIVWNTHKEKHVEDTKITVIAKVRAKAEMADVVKEELLAFVNRARTEPGCVNYDLHQCVDDRSLFIFYENWGSMADLERHRTMPYLKTFREKAESLLADPIEVTLLEMIS